jgi:hypothetical protein
MDIPLNVEVLGTDGRIGRSTNVVFNPITEVITHLVVRLNERPHTEYLVPVKLVGETTSASITLRCTGQQLQEEQVFNETEFISVQTHYYADAYGWPLSVPETTQVAVHHQHIPLDEMAVRRGAEVKASDAAWVRLMNS